MASDIQAIEQAAQEQSNELLTVAEQGMALAKEYVIDSPEMYQLAARELATIKGQYKNVEAVQKSMTQPLRQSEKTIRDFFRPILARLSDTETLYKNGMKSYDQEQERIRREQQEAARKAREEEERLAREAAEKTAAEAEAKRKAIQEAKDEESKKAAQAAAEEAEKQAAIKAAEQKTVEMAPAPVVLEEKVEVSGISRRTTWSAEIVDLMELAKAVVEGKQPIDLILPNTKVINGLAKSLKGALNIPGVKVVEEKTIASRSA